MTSTPAAASPVTGIATDACRSLWRAVLITQFRIAVRDIRYFGGPLSVRDQAAALDWFFTRDGAIVAMFAGLDIDMVRDRVQGIRDAFRAAQVQRAQPRFGAPLGGQS